VRLLLIIFGLFRIIVKRKRSIIKWKRRKTKRRLIFKWRRKRGRCKSRQKSREKELGVKLVGSKRGVKQEGRIWEGM
jgi:hypothetical protein